MLIEVKSYLNLTSVIAHNVNEKIVRKQTECYKTVYLGLVGKESLEAHTSCKVLTITSEKVNDYHCRGVVEGRGGVPIALLGAHNDEDTV